jgi:hypothetical protein
MGVDVQPRHPDSNPCGCEFWFLLFIKKLVVGVSPTAFLSKKNINTWLANIVGDVDNVHVEIDNLNNPLASFCFRKSIGIFFTRKAHGSPTPIDTKLRASPTVHPILCLNYMGIQI